MLGMYEMEEDLIHFKTNEIFSWYFRKECEVDILKWMVRQLIVYTVQVPNFINEQRIKTEILWICNSRFLIPSSSLYEQAFKNNIVNKTLFTFVVSILLAQ